MKTTLMIISFFSYLAVNSQNQYVVKLGNKEIGEIHTSAIRNENTTVYRVNSDTKVSLLFNFTYQSQLEAVYKDGLLLGASASSYQNGKKKDDTEISKTGTIYKIRHADEGELTYRAPIKYSVAMLYFKEPIGMDKVFSETHGTFCKLEQTNSSVYKLILPDGELTYYHYNHGKLQRVVLERLAYDISFNLVSSK